jgi:hypothetical protein
VYWERIMDKGVGDVLSDLAPSATQAKTNSSSWREDLGEVEEDQGVNELAAAGVHGGNNLGQK